MVNLKLILIIGAAIAFVSAGGIQFTRTAVDEAKKLKDEIIPPNSKPKTNRINSMTRSKLNDANAGENV